MTAGRIHDLVNNRLVIQMFLPGVVGVDRFKTKFLRVSTQLCHMLHDCQNALAWFAKANIVLYALYTCCISQVFRQTC